MLRKPVYYVKTTWASLVRNPVLNLVSAVTIALALLILGAFLLINVNLNRIVESAAHGLSVSVYLKDGLKPARLDQIKKEVVGLGGVAAVRYIGKDEALNDLRKNLGPQGGLLDGLGENPLPASLELELTPDMGSQGRIEALARRIGSLEGVDDVSYAWEWAEKLKIFVRFVRLAGYAVGGLLFLVIVFIIANTIKLTVMARQEEVDIMRLIGATEGFIRTPFIIEGVVQGLAGGLAALLGLYAVFGLFISQVRLPLGLSAVELIFLPGSLCWFLILVGGFLGFVGSFISLGRFAAS